MNKEKWLTWSVFYELSEINTAFLNIVWFIFGAALAYKWFHAFNLINVILCLICVFLFDLAVNISDNYFDYIHSKDEHFRQETNPIGKLHLPLNGVKHLTVISYLVSMIPGIFLVMRTGWQVLLIGILGYVIGIFYTAGPKPINATIFCELAVSVSISILPAFTSMYVSIYNTIPLSWDLTLRTLLMCLPLTFLFFAWQLANNVCDLDEDRLNGRFTLANKLGKKTGIIVIKWLIIIGMLFPIVLFLMQEVNGIVLLSCICLPIVYHNLKQFFETPDKRKTFILVVKNFSLFLVVYIALVTLTFVF